MLLECFELGSGVLFLGGGGSVFLGVSYFVKERRDDCCYSECVKLNNL